jgi:hypothetical protein
MGSGLVFLFVICVLAAILIATVNVLAASYPVVALCVAEFCLVMLTVLIVLVLARRGNEC